jgi:ketosteroid isomerase-like protein
MNDHAQIVRGAYDAFAKGDIPAVLALIDDRCEWLEAEHSPYWPGGALVGPQAVLEGVFMRLGQDFGDTFAVNVRRIVDCGDTVVMEDRYTGTAQASGKALDAQVTHVWDLRDGKVVRWQQYTDTHQFAEVMGVSPAIERGAAAAT